MAGVNVNGDVTCDGTEDPITDVPVDATPATPTLRPPTALDAKEASAATPPGAAAAVVGGLPRRATASTATALMSLRSRVRSAASAEPITLRSAQSDPVGMDTLFRAHEVSASVRGKGDVLVTYDLAQPRY